MPTRGPHDYEGAVCRNCGEQYMALGPTWCEKYPGAPPQAGGGDAGERDYLERAHAVLRDGHRRHLREPPGGKNLTLCEVDAIAAALRSSHREGAEAMREEAAQAGERWIRRNVAKHSVYADEVRDAIRALPIPGSKIDAG